MTDVVVTVDDDIIVTARDLTRMETILRAQKLRRVVGPFPRWWDTNNNYLWLPAIDGHQPAAHVGYDYHHCFALLPPLCLTVEYRILAP